MFFFDALFASLHFLFLPLRLSVSPCLSSLSYSFSYTHAHTRTCTRTRTHTMAPIIQSPSQDTINALQNVLKRRIDTNRIIKEKKMLSGEDYRLMEIELNNKQFLQPLDADNTKASIYYIRQKFIRYALRLGSK
jgi:hypothetical protein